MSCQSDIFSFADDTTLCVSNADVPTLYLNANAEINKLYHWFCANKLMLNATKTKYIIIKPNQRKCNVVNMSLEIGGTQLMRIGKVKHFLPYDSLRTIYYALIHPHLSYGILAWGNAKDSILKKTILLQKRALRYIHNSGYNSHTDQLFQHSGILKLRDLYEFQISLFMYDYCHNKLTNSFGSVFKFNHEVQPVRTTRQSDLMHIPRCHSQFSSKLPLYNFPIYWNKWSDIGIGLQSRSSFKRHIKAGYIDSYLSEVNCTNTNCMDCNSKK